MTEKYIDLASRISSESGAYHLRDTIIEGVLEWLDEHPDQVPGRTITVSEFDEAVESCITEDATVPPHTFAARLGVVCVPDPEPTNVQSIDKLLTEFASLNASCGGEQGDHDLAEFLDAHGVRVSRDD